LFVCLMKVVRDVQYCVAVVRMANEGSAGRTILCCCCSYG